MPVAALAAVGVVAAVLLWPGADGRSLLFGSSGKEGLGGSQPGGGMSGGVVTTATDATCVTNGGVSDTTAAPTTAAPPVLPPTVDPASWEAYWTAWAAQSAPLSGTKMIALTFDDGPSQYTDQILDILQAKGAVATFFVQGRRCAQYAAQMRREVAMGCEVGAHSYAHVAYTNMTPEETAADMQQTTDAIYAACGRLPMWMRPPGGYVTDAMNASAAALGQRGALWSVDSRDWESRNHDKIMATIFSEAQDGGIVLMHDVYQTTADTVGDVIDRFRSEGYTFVTLSQLAYARTGGIGAAGTVYRRFYPTATTAATTTTPTITYTPPTTTAPTTTMTITAPVSPAA